MNHGVSRKRLLATASTMALVLSICGSGQALASGEPPVWFEFGWNFENVRNSASDIGLPLGPLVPQTGLTAPLADNFGFSRSYTDEGKITFQPGDSDWIFSASVRYGRARGHSNLRQSLTPIPTTNFVSYHKSVPHIVPWFQSYYDQTRVRHVPVSAEKISEDSSNAESHFIIDFAAGKDVGLGLFGHGSTSQLSAGVRFAHFTTSRKASNFQETQGIHFQTSHSTYPVWMRTTGLPYRHYVPFYHTKRRERWDAISADGGVSQNFAGIGPSIKWEASAKLWENPRGGDLSLDWGVNAALLFGKQKKAIHHQTTSGEHCFGDRCPAHPAVYTSNGDARASKTVTVPNVGGFAGVTASYSDIKVSLGYRADLFVNAVDVGFAARKSSNLLFHGPFASLSIGVGN